jgi:hypothetical protein
MRALFEPGGPRNAILFSVALTPSSLIAPDSLSLAPETNVTLAIFPNPARSMITVKATAIIKAGTTLEIYNEMGQKLMDIPLNQHLQEVNVSSLRNGVYYIHNKSTGRAIKLLKM